MAKLVPVDFDPFSGATSKGATGPKLVPVDFDPFAKKQTEPLPGQVQLQDVPGFISTANIGPTFYTPIETLVKQDEAKKAAAQPTPEAELEALPRVNVPLPLARPPEFGPSEVTLPPAQEKSPVVGSVGGEWGQLTKLQGEEAKANRIAATEAAIPVAKAEEAVITDIEQKQLKAFTDKDGVPLVDKIANLEAVKQQAKDQGDQAAFKTAQIAINNVKASAPFEFRTLLTKQKLGTTDTDLATEASIRAEQAAVSAKEAPADTQTFARNAFETVGKTSGDVAVSTIVSAQRALSIPFVAISAITGNEDPTVIGKALDLQEEYLKSIVDKGFVPDPAQVNDLGTKVVAGVASSGLFIAGGAVGKVFKLSPYATTAILGALPQAEQSWQEAKKRAAEDPSLDQEWRKWTAFALGAGVGTSESLPVGKLFERLENISGGSLTRAIGMTMASMGENGVQEFLQQIAQNAISINLLKDPNVTIGKDAVDAAIVGALSGAATTGPLVGAKMAWTSLKRSGPATPPPSASTTPPAAPPSGPAAAPPSGPAAPPAAGGTNLLPVDFDPFQPAAPSADVENQAGVLKSAGYAVEDIAEMTEGQRLALVAEAVDQGVKPADLTAEEKAVLTPAQPPSPVAPVEAQGPGVAPAPEAPSTQVQALVDAGASPLEAIQQAGAEGPVANKPVSEEERLMKEFQDNWQAEQDAQKPIEAPPVAEAVAPKEPAAPKMYGDIIGPNRNEGNDYNRGFSLYPGTVGEANFRFTNGEDYNSIGMGGNKLLGDSTLFSSNKDKDPRGGITRPDQMLEKLKDPVLADLFAKYVDQEITQQQLIEQLQKTSIPRREQPATTPVAEAPSTDIPTISEEELNQQNRDFADLVNAKPNYQSPFGNVNEAPPAEAPSVGAANITSSKTKNGWVIQTRDSDGKVLAEHGPFKDPKTAQNKVSELISSNTRATVETNKMVTPEGIVTGFKRQDRGTYSTLIGYIKSKGGIRDDGGELKARGMNIPGLINPRGMTIQDALRGAIDRGFYPDYVERGDKDDNYLPPKEMVEQFKDDIAARKKLPDPEKETKEELSREQDEENDRLSYYEDKINEALNDLDHTGTDRLKREAAIIMYNGEEDPLTALELAHLGEIADDLPGEHDSIRDITSDEYWSTVEDHLIDREEEISNEVEQRPTPETGTAPRETGKQEQAPATEEAEGRGKPVEKAVVKSPEKYGKNGFNEQTEAYRDELVNKALDSKREPIKLRGEFDTREQSDYEINKVWESLGSNLRKALVSDPSLSDRFKSSIKSIHYSSNHSLNINYVDKNYGFIAFGDGTMLLADEYYPDGTMVSYPDNKLYNESQERAENDPTPAPVETSVKKLPEKNDYKGPEARPVKEDFSIGGMPKGKKGKKTVEIVNNGYSYDIMVNGAKVGNETDSSSVERVAELLANSKLNFQYTDDGGRVAELTVNENVPSPVNASALPEDIDPKDVLVLIACSSTKADVQGKVPLHELYTGAFWQILNKYRGNIPSQNIHVLSGKYGIIPEYFLSAPYDEQLTKEKVDQLINDGINPYNFAFQGYKAVILAGGGEYRRAFHFIVNEMKKSKIVNSDILSPKAVIVETTGGIGEQRGQFAKYLNQANGVTKETVEETEKPVEAEAPAIERQLPKDNYRKDLSEYAKKLYRETDPESALRQFIPGSNWVDGTNEWYLSDDKDLALGQGKNKGVILELDPSAFDGQINTQKPTWKFLWQSGKAEYIGRVKKDKDARSAVTSFTVLDDVKMELGTLPNFTRNLDRLVSEGWTKEKVKGGVKYSRPEAEAPAVTKLIGEEDIPKIQKMLDAKLRPGYKVRPSGRESGKGVLIYMPGIKEPSYQQIMEDIPSWIDGIIRLVPEEAKAPTVEKGAEGKPQLVIPGAERIGDKEYAERLAGKPLKATGAQAEPGGMFAADVGQPDLIDLSRKTEPVKTRNPNITQFLKSYAEGSTEGMRSNPDLKEVAEYADILSKFTDEEWDAIGSGFTKSFNPYVNALGIDVDDSLSKLSQMILDDKIKKAGKGSGGGGSSGGIRIQKAAEEQPFLPENVIKGKPLTEEDKAQRDEVNILTDIPPEAPPPPPKDMSLPEAEQILKGKKLTVEKRGDRFLVGGNTFNYKSIMRDNNGRWDAKEKSWSFTYDPTKNIAASIKEVDSVTSSTRDGGQNSGPLAKRGEDERIRKLREREDGRPDERISNASAKVSDGTKSLIANGLKYGIPQEVVNDQIEDIGMALNAFDKGKPMFLLANEAGTGKTFVLGGLIRDLRSKGVKKFVYVTQSQDLIGQIKDNLKSYDIGEVQFVTYAQMDADVRDGVLIFDEAHNVKNVIDQTKRAVEGQRMMQSAKMTVFASATPFQNPVEAAYLAGTGVFNASDGFTDWAKAYGAYTQTTTFYNIKTKDWQTIEKLYWVSTPEKKKDGAAARNWFLKQGVMTQRAMKIDPKMVDVTFQRNPVDKKWVDLYNKINEAYDAALAGFENEDGESSDNKVSGEIKRHRETMIKRILEAAKANAAIDRAKNLLADGKNVVIFVETKADRTIGRFRRSTFFKDDTLYSYDQMEKMMSDWAIEEAGAKMIKATPPPRPFAAFIYAIAQGMNKVGLDQMLPSTADDIRDALGGKDKVAIYTGAASQAQAKKDKEEFLSGRKKVLIATMAKGGTGLSLHDTIGNRPTVQVNLNLPWAAWQVDQVSARVARYGLQSKANVEWLFASNIPWESDKLAPRIGARMADMGAIVKGIEIKAAEKLLGDFDFEGTLDVKNKKGEGNIEYSSSGFTPRAEIIIPNVISRVEETVRRLVGDKIAVEFVDKITMVDPEAARMSGGEEGGSAAGSYDNANGIIKLALDMDNPASPLYTAYHEAYHPISSLLTEQEKAILRNSVDELRSIATKFYRMTNEQFDALSPDEQEAYAFGAYGYMMDESMGVPAGPARGIMGRLRSYWKSIVGAIKSALGKRTYEDIFSDIHLGRLRERFDTARINMPSPRYAAKNNQPNLPGVPAPATQQPTVQNILPGLPVANRTGLGYEIKRSGFGSKFHYLFTEKFVDLFDWIKAVEAARGAKIQDSENAAFANALFQDRAIALQNKANEEELQPLIKAMEKQGISTGDMGMFLYAMHAPERNEVMRQRNPAMFGPDGAGSGMTDDEAADIMQQFKDAGKYDDLMQIAKDHIYPMIKKDVKLRYTSGLLTQEQYDQYNESRLNGGYDYYVPLTGYAEDENQLEKTPPRVGKGFAVYGQEYKTAFGRNSLALNPLFSLINRRMEGITRTEKTRVISRLYNFVRNNPNPDYAEIVKPGTEFTKKLGADGTVQVVPTNSVRMDPFVITHKIGGKEVYIRFNNSNPNMARLVEELKNMTQAPDTLMKATMAFGRYMSKINTQWVVDFMMVNFPRDVQDSLLTIYGEKKGLASGMIASIAKSGKIIGMHNSGAKLSTQDKILLDEWVESGGKVDYTGLWNLENTVDRLKDQLQEQLTDMNAAQKSLSIAKNMGNGVLEAIETINDTFDSTVRLAVYMSARKAGYTKEQAALLGRRSTVDFRTGGKLKPFINAAYPFAGTAIAGSKALTRILRSKRAWQAIGGVVMASMFSSLLGTYLSDDDEEDPTKKKFWTEIKDYNRHNSIILPFKINGRYVKFAAGFYISTFWSLGDQMAGVLTGNIKPTDAAINVATSIANAFNPLGSGSLIHNIIPIQMRPFIETYMNKDWQNKDMHPEREGRSKSSQYYDKTSETAVTLADWVNRKFGGNPYESSVMDTYPANIDYWFNFITGGAGAQVTNSGKAVYDYFSGADIPAEKLPFVRRVITSTQNIDDSAYSKVRNEVGARSARLSSSYADSQNMAIPKERRIEAREVSKELKKELGSSYNGKKIENPPGSLPGIIRETDKSVKELEERIDKINIRNDLSAIQKKALVDPIQNKITAKKNTARKKIIHKEQIKTPPPLSPLNQLKTMFQ